MSGSLFPDAPYHWLDCNIFVEAKNGSYSFDIAPGFWRWMEKVSKDNLVRSPISVYNELAKGNDPLSRWVRHMKKSSGLFVTPDAMVQKCFGEIAVFVQSHYDAPQASHFLSGADPWVIAHAMENRGIVVTHEAAVGPGSTKPKIPNVCDHFDVKHARAYDAFATLKL